MNHSKILTDFFTRWPGVSIKGFAEDAGINRRNLYGIKAGQVTPGPVVWGKIEKTLKKYGYEL